jgi:cytochrome b
MEQNQVAGHSTRPAEIKVWDIAVRVFHWSLVAGFVIAYITADEWDKAHEVVGYIVAGLITFRIFWGFIGGKYAQFSDFVYRPRAVVAYLKDMKAGKAKRYIGHNPAGGAMILALIASMIFIAATGFAMTLDAFWGAEWLEEMHEFAVHGTLVLIVAHIIGVVMASREHGENLAKSMVTGKKRRE